MNHDNRNKSAPITKTAAAVIEALKAQGVDASHEHEAATISAATAPTPKPVKKEVIPRLNLDKVKAAAQEAGLSFGAYAYGRYSMGIELYDGAGQLETQIDVGCSGEKYWITLTDYLPSFTETKWCMPRDEVNKDRADDFLAELIADTTGSTESWSSLISIILGIAPLASIGYTKDILARRRSAELSKSCA